MVMMMTLLLRLRKCSWKIRHHHHQQHQATRMRRKQWKMATLGIK
jgi:hypothetical protein